MDVSKECGGLPLALKVVGSRLFDHRSDEDLECVWPEAIDALKKDKSVMSVLRWSYDSLSEEEKVMFVDIACVFHGWEKEVLEIWKSCKNNACCDVTTPNTSLRSLVDKCLVVVEFSNGCNVLGMHGLLRGLGESIGMCEGSHLWECNAKKAMEYKTLGLNKVRALNLAKSARKEFECKNLAKMINLQFLVMDGCNVSGDLGSISEELRWLRWRDMPLTFIPPTLNLANIISLNFSYSTMLASLWVESEPALEVCSKLLTLQLTGCTSIKTLPDSIRGLSQLQVLNLSLCENLQKLPSSIGHLIGLEELYLIGCERLEALLESITTLSGLQTLFLCECSSILNLPTTFGLMIGFVEYEFLVMSLATESNVCALAQLNAHVKHLIVEDCSDEAMRVLDGLAALGNKHHLWILTFSYCASMTKMPRTIGLLTSLYIFNLYRCVKLRKLPYSIGQLKWLIILTLRKCHSLETLPGSLGALICLEELVIVKCMSLTKLRRSLGHLSKLQLLYIADCSELRQLPECIRQLHRLECLAILDCGSLERMEVVRAMQGLRIWGCTSVTELPRSCLMVVTNKFCNPSYYNNYDELIKVSQGLKEVQLVEANDCGLIRLVQEHDHKRMIWQRVHKRSHCRLSMVESGVRYEVYGAS